MGLSCFDDILFHQQDAYSSVEISYTIKLPKKIFYNTQIQSNLLKNVFGYIILFTYQTNSNLNLNLELKNMFSSNKSKTKDDSNVKHLKPGKII